jgi:hypothetical protein
MTDANPLELGFLSKVVIACAVLLTAASVLWYGIIVEVCFASCATYLIGRSNRCGSVSFCSRQ